MAIGTAAAVIGASVIGAGSSIMAGNKAAKAQSRAADQATALQREQFQQAREDNAPYRSVGYGALAKLAGMYGVPYSASGLPPGETDYAGYVDSNPDLAAEYGRVSDQFSDKADYGRFHHDTYGQGEGRPVPAAPDVGAGGGQFGFDAGDFQASPGYQFRVSEAMKAIERSAAARGGLRSGATMDALQRRVQGVASDEYNNYSGNLMRLAGLGESATARDTAAGANYAANAGQTIMQGGNARASAYANTGSAINQGVQNLASTYLYGQGYGKPQTPGDVMVTRGRGFN